MKYCDQCGNKLKDNAKFCPVCGAPVYIEESAKPPVCKKCGELAEDGALFCSVCGERYYAVELKQKASGDNRQRTLMPVNEDAAKFIAEYVSRVAVLEKSVYTQNRTIEQLESQIGSLGHPNSYERPVEPNHASLFDDADPKGTFSIAGFGAMIGGFIGLFAGSILWGAFIGGALLLGGVCLWQAIENSNYNSAADEEYRKNMNWYKASIAADKERVSAEFAEKRKLVEILHSMKDKRDETAGVLESYYGKDIIFPKYRNLIAACSFYEYFASGRCSSLTGHEGAYNIYENEARLERICTKIDEVIINLEQVRNNQYYLYAAIQEGNQISQQLLTESVRQSKLVALAAENSAIAAHNAEIAANNAEACAWIGVANYLSIEDGKRRLNN